MIEGRNTATELVIYAHSRPGVLAKIASVFHRRALNIGALTVDATDDPERAKIVVRLVAPRATLERVALAIDNLVDVLSVELA
jgi:acetolactate synthase-1/3 small subunit